MAAMKHDKELIRRRFEQRLESYDSLATVQRAIAERLAERIFEHMERPPLTAVEIGTGTGFLTRPLTARFSTTHWLLNDLVAGSRAFLPEGLPFVAGDGETMELPERIDLIASASTVQWFDDLPLFLERAARRLAPGGVVALSTFGPAHFREITATTGQGLDYPTLESLAAWCEAAGLEPLHAEQWEEQKRYDNPIEVLRHLKATGVNAVVAERWTHGRLRRFEADYRRLYPDVPLTFHPLLMIARKR